LNLKRFSSIRATEPSIYPNLLPVPIHSND
jgi:hypothetical protein